MITFPRLGQIGRLGNHLFQIAATIGLALDHDEHFGFPRWVHEDDFQLLGCFHETLPADPLYKEPRFAHDPIPFQPALAIEGFFQSEKYFSSHADRIRSMLTPQKPSSHGELSRTASLHVRRGDYLLLPEKHPILPMTYYLEAMDRLRSDGASKFLIFSDDLPWCRAQHWPADAEVVPDLGTMDQFRLTMDCAHHILANSTFSWWSAWLSYRHRKTVITPSSWFGEAYCEKFPTTDLFPSDWIIL